jgi:cobalt/nickel transport protein
MKSRSLISVFLCVVFFPGVAAAHFGMIIPSDSMVMPGENSTISATCSFSHPMEMVGMDLDRPRQVGVLFQGRKTDLLKDIKETKVMGHRAWMFDYRMKRPGVYQFYMVPEPFWEPAERRYIIHYTKTVTAAFGDEGGWDKPVGLKTEIVPLTRPFGLYAGNTFQGVVMLEGQPVPYAEVEVEYYNQTGRAKAPNDYMITQLIKADAGGVFTYSVPRSGWWGFASLITSDQKMMHKGEAKEVELGAVIWVEFKDWQER